MKKTIIAGLVASGLLGCTSVETATVSSAEVAANGEAVAVVQANALGLTALFHIVDLVQSDLDTVVNKLLVAEAKAMGATKIDLKTAHTTPRHGLYAIFTSFPFILGITESSATGVAVK